MKLKIFALPVLLLSTSPALAQPVDQLDHILPTFTRSVAPYTKEVYGLYGKSYHFPKESLIPYIEANTPVELNYSVSYSPELRDWTKNYLTFQVWHLTPMTFPEGVGYANSHVNGKAVGLVPVFYPFDCGDYAQYSRDLVIESGDGINCLFQIKFAQGLMIVRGVKRFFVLNQADELEKAFLIARRAMAYVLGTTAKTSGKFVFKDKEGNARFSISSATQLNYGKEMINLSEYAKTTGQSFDYDPTTGRAHISSPKTFSVQLGTKNCLMKGEATCSNTPAMVFNREIYVDSEVLVNYETMRLKD